METLVGLQIIAILAALVFCTFGMTANQTRRSCSSEVLAVRNALTKFQLQFANTNPRNLYVLVPIGLMQSIPGPNSASVTAGFTYDPTAGTYAGGICP